MIGFSNVEPFLFLETELKRREELGWSSGLTKGTIEERVNPLLSMENAKSFISIGVSYPRKAELPQQDKKIHSSSFVVRHGGWIIITLLGRSSNSLRFG